MTLFHLLPTKIAGILQQETALLRNRKLKGLAQGGKSSGTEHNEVQAGNEAHLGTREEVAGEEGKRRRFNRGVGH